MNVALYLRRSSNERLQADSLNTQEQILRAYAKGHAMRVVAVYRDSASGTSTKHRRAFLQMVETITHGAPFSAVLVRDVSRFGRFYDMDEAAFFEVLFLGHHVKTIYCEEVFTGDTTPMASLIKSVRRVMAAEYSRDRARLVRYGQARATRMGFHVTGPAPYGLQRVMVGGNGEPVCELRPGEWKALSSHRTVLAPGPSDQLATVQRIFAEFTGSGRTVAEIVRRLNAEGVASPQGCRWNAPTVTAILRNPRYVGVSRYRVRQSPGLNETVLELAQGRFPGSPTITQEVWDRAQERIAASVRRTSNDELAGDLRKAYELNGCAEERMLTNLSRRVCWETINARFSAGIDGALAHAYQMEISSARTFLNRILESSFEILSDSEGWTIGGSLTLSFRSAFLHRSRWGRHWSIQTGRLERDLVLAVGIGPSGKLAGFFLASRTQLQARACGVRAIGRHAVEPSQVAGRLNALRSAPLDGVEQAFLATARKSGVVNFAQLSRSLDWPADTTRRTYWRLVSRGEWLPPLKKSARRWVEFTCGACGKSRWEPVNKTLTRKTERCRPCADLRPVRKILLRCPKCGREDARWPSAVKRLSAGAETVCRRCSLKHQSEGKHPRRQLGSTLIATSHPSRLSRTFHTSPIPPAPSGARIS